MGSSRVYDVLGPCLIFLAVLLVYSAGLSGGFIFDDYPNIVGNPALSDGEGAPASLRDILVAGISTPLGRPLSVLSFAVNQYLTGADPFYFKLANILLHALNGILMYFLIRLVLRTTSLARHAPVDMAKIRLFTLIVALAWGLHPINLTSVLYVVQRMNSLSALFVLSGLLVYTSGRSRMLEIGKGHLRVAAALTLFLLPAVLCKENGILLPLFAGLLETCLFRFQCNHDRDRRFLIILFLVIVLLPLLVLLTVVALQPDLVFSNYLRRSFTPVQRLLTEGRVLWLYIYLILLPNTRDLSLFHDDIELSIGLLQPMSTLYAFAGLVAMALLAWGVRIKQPLISFGIWFFLVGHSLESSILPLELVHEHRNYLPGMGLLLALFTPLFAIQANTISPKIRYGAVVALLLAYSLVTTARAIQWGDDLLLRYQEVLHHPDSPRANYEMGRIYALMLEEPGFKGDRQVLYEGARGHFLQADRAQDGSVEALIALILLDATYDRMTEEHHLRSLYASLATHVPGATGSMAIRALLRCQSSQSCQVNETVILSVINSLLNNSELNGRDASLLLQAIGEYLWNHTHDYRGAKTAAEYAVKIDVDGVPPRLLLASILIEIGDRPGAVRQLENARARDALNLYNETINGLQSRLNN